MYPYSHSETPHTHHQQPQLLMIDDLHHEPCFDLYLQLIRQPSMMKKQSVGYDYNCQEAKVISVNTDGNKENLTILTNAHSPTATATAIHCNCTRTKCQKNYCQCFKAGQACGSQCACVGCCNDELTRQVVRKRSLGAGCKCQRSRCLKKYCECHSGGRRCGEGCRCVGCWNGVEGSGVEGNGGSEGSQQMGSQGSHGSQGSQQMESQQGGRRGRKRVKTDNTLKNPG